VGSINVGQYTCILQTMLKSLHHIGLNSNMPQTDLENNFCLYQDLNRNLYDEQQTH
jgi:hypothetical protein